MKLNTIIQGDCLKVMKGMADKSVDLTVTSPPYDNLRTYKGYDFRFGGIAKELFRITKDGGVLVWVVGDATIDGSETGTSFRQALSFKEIGFNLHDTMIYEKASLSFPEENRYYPAFEYMFIFSKGKPKTVNLICDRKNNYAGTKISSHSREPDGSFRKKSGTGNKIKEYGVRFNIWRIANLEKKNRNGHPAPFPERLAQDHILSWSNVGDLVLDPMCGSGTTCKMAKIHGRNFIGIEISPEYCKIANERLAQEVLF